MYSLQVTGRSFGDKDFRTGLENGILLCELLNAIRPGAVKKINRLPTPIAGLDNITLFLRACEELGLKGSQLFDPGDLQDVTNRATINFQEIQDVKEMPLFCPLTEFEAVSSHFFDDSRPDTASVSTEISQYDPSKHSPVFYGHMVAKVSVDTSVLENFNSAYSHPALLGYAVVQKPPPPASPPPPPPTPPPDQKTCSPKQYLEHYIFPVLLPGLFETLKQAKIEKCFERKRTKFNACDFLSEWLYNKNLRRSDKKFVAFNEIPFVKDWLKDHPRPLIPLSLLLSEDEAALLIQSFWRGYQVRRDPAIQELRQWQKELKEENRGFQRKVITFWAEQESKGDMSLYQALNFNALYKIVLTFPEGNILRQIRN
ncbi:hypothetical protein scyTo_0008841 [Scyliorhinus torazame]|uniref:Calponin-homology (CH) domain-containing protein n=1 Tax=Scyliorhinus torazame TaxID=75743 RepID=A0A401PEC8_SCYTO|nr:hypothetical protein [Scyliorhinus torazame]